MAKRIDPKTKTPPAPVGAPGLMHWGGYVQSEWDRRLQGPKGPQTYREMAEGNPTIGALLFAIEALVRSAGYRIEPADESAEAQAEAEFVESCFEDMEGAWGDTLSEILTFVPYGFSLFETVYKVRRGDTGMLQTSSSYDDNRIGWARWSPRSQETILRWEIADDGTVTAAYQTAPPTYREVSLPLNKCIHFRARSRRQNPEGLSLLRNCFEPYYYIKHITRIEAIGIERDLAGLPMLRIPADVIAEGGAALNTYTKMATDLRKDEQAGVVLPSDVDENGNALYELSLLSTGGQRAMDTDAVVARYERWILRAMLADFLTLGDNAVGSYAQSVSRTDLFMTAVSSILDGTGDTINAQAVQPLLRLNGVPANRWPRFTFNELDQRDIKAFAETVAILAGAGVVDTSEPDLKQYIYDVVGLPLAQETDEQEQEQEGATVQESAQDAPESPQNDEPQQDTAKAASEPRKAMEPITVDEKLLIAGRAAWRERMGKYAGLLDAEVA